jgi:hypothetical protein
MADNRGQEAQALVKDGIIYLTDHQGEWSDNHGHTRTAFVEGGRRNLCYH